MYCPQCGTQNDNSAAFCGNCGTNLNNAPTQNKSINRTTTTTFRSAIQYSANPVLNAIEKLAVSPLSFVAAIAFSLMIFFYISNAEVISVNIMGALRAALDEAGELTSDIRSALSLLNGASRFIATIVMIPDIIIAAGIWITVYSVFDRSKEDLSLSGIKAIRVINTISYVLSIISIVGYIFLSLWLFSRISEAGATLPPLAFIVMFVVLCAMFFRAYYLSKINELLDSFKYTIIRRQPSIPSAFVSIMCFISCGVYVLMALIDGGLTNWCGAVAFLGFGLIINKYRGIMDELQRKARSFETNTEASDTTVSEEDTDEDTPKNNSGKFFILGTVGVILAIAIALAATYTAPNIDKQIIGKWQYGSNEEAVFEFKRNGTYIGNAGTEYEEIGTYTAIDGVMTLIIDGKPNEVNYQVIDSDRIKMERSYITSNWERKYRWETLYRLD